MSLGSKMFNIDFKKLSKFLFIVREREREGEGERERLVAGAYMTFPRSHIKNILGQTCLLMCCKISLPGIKFVRFG